MVGLTSEAFEVDVAIATRAAAAALPVAPASRQNVMAVGLLTCQRALAGLGAGHEELHGLCRAAFDAAPDAHAWALRYARDARTSERTFRRQTAPHVVSYAVEGIAASTVDQPSTRLVKLLEECIDDTARRVDRAGSSAPRGTRRLRRRGSRVRGGWRAARSRRRSEPPVTQGLGSDSMADLRSCPLTA